MGGRGEADREGETECPGFCEAADPALCSRDSERDVGSY